METALCIQSFPFPGFSGIIFFEALKNKDGSLHERRNIYGTESKRQVD
jgi:hypothetical protein